jgi:ketosteroid isomerase-like protein
MHNENTVKNKQIVTFLYDAIEAGDTGALAGVIADDSLTTTRGRLTGSRTRSCY